MPHQPARPLSAPAFAPAVGDVVQLKTSSTPFVVVEEFVAYRLRGTDNSPVIEHTVRACEIVPAAPGLTHAVPALKIHDAIAETELPDGPYIAGADAPAGCDAKQLNWSDGYDPETCVASRTADAGGFVVVRTTNGKFYGKMLYRSGPHNTSGDCDTIDEAKAWCQGESEIPF